MSLLTSLIPILTLIILLVLNVVVFKDDATYGPNQLALIIAAVCSIALGIKNTSWKQIIEGIEKNIKISLGAIIILLLIGSLIGTWVLSGIVPSLIYYGLGILNPSYFLVTACVICAVVSIATGSSWSTSGTIGIALVGVGKAMGIPEEMSVGAVISGAYFGDKMSPLSDTTNLSAAMAGANLFDHIKYMMFTTIPSVVIAIIIFTIIGLSFNGEYSPEKVNEIQSVLANQFNISPMLFLIPVLVVYLIYRKLPTIAVIFIGMLLAGVAAIPFQSKLIASLSSLHTSSFYGSYEVVVKAATMGIEIDTGNKMVNDLVGAKGMVGMLNTVWLILCAMVFGGALEATGMLKTISNFIIGRVESFFSLIASTVGTCLFFNITASDQYLAVVVPGRMFEQEYKKRGLAPVNLSRTLEDSGTVTSVLVPWNTCGAYHAGLFGVSTWAYLPYCFFNLISPLMTILFAAFYIKIKKKLIV